MAKKSSIYECPHCGDISFNPVTKALAGGMNTKGRPCPSCGLRAVNGQLNTIVQTIILLIALAIVIFLYFKCETNWAVYMLITIVSAWLLSTVFNAFFGPLIKVLRNDV